MFEIIETKDDIRHVHNTIEYTEIDKSQLIKVMFLENKYDGQRVATIIKAGSRVDRRALTQLGEGGTKAWEFIPNDDQENLLGHEARLHPPFEIHESVDFIFIDPRVLRLHRVYAPIYNSNTIVGFPTEILLKDKRCKQVPISIG